MKKNAKMLGVFLLVLLFGCTPKPQKYSDSRNQLFDTVITVTAYSDSQEQFDKLSATCFDEFDRLNKLFDIYNEYMGVTNLCSINRLAGQAPIKADKEIMQLLEKGKQLYSLTEGRVNIAFGSVLTLWSQGREQKKAPAMAALEQQAEHCDIEDLKLENDSVFFADNELKLDVGAIAKGVATQMVADVLEKEGYKDFVISAGGNVIAMGKGHGGKKWQVGVQNPDESGSIIAVIEAENQSLVSSGGYLRYFEENGVRYHHIIDPKTLMPANKTAGTTVVHANSGIADALSTATFMMTPQEAMEFIKTIDGARLIVVTKDGEVLDSDEIQG